MLLRALVASLGLIACAASANPALTGDWRGEIAGVAVALMLDGKGAGVLDGSPVRYQTQGNMLFIERQGVVSVYQFELRNEQLLVAGSGLPGVLVLSRAAAAKPAPSAGAPPAPEESAVRPELVGRWCQASTFMANRGGGSQSSVCFELRPNGTYVYASERSMDAYGTGMWGGTSSSSSDAGRWSATAVSITAQSNSGRATIYRLEKRNHPKNRDPMLCLDGECYVTYWQKAPW
jgi:hypothetical protein